LLFIFQKQRIKNFVFDKYGLVAQSGRALPLQLSKVALTSQAGASGSKIAIANAIELPDESIVLFTCNSLSEILNEGYQVGDYSY